MAWSRVSCCSSSSSRQLWGRPVSCIATRMRPGPEAFWRGGQRLLGTIDLYEAGDRERLVLHGHLLQLLLDPIEYRGATK